MFNVYIQNFVNSAGKYVTTPTLMFSIPSNSDGLPVKTATISASEGNSETFSFTMEASSPYYNSLRHMKTLFRIEYGTDVIFYGRVLTESKSTFLQTKQVQCEGAFSFLNDTYYEGVKEEKLKKISITDYFNKLINNHNNYIGNDSSVAWKKLYAGRISFTPKTEARKYEPTSWTQSVSLVKDLASKYGGYIQARYASGKAYLDWFKDYRRDLGNGKRPSIKLGKNLIDFSNSADVDNIFTRLIPIGGSDEKGEPVYIDGVGYTDINGASRTLSTKYIPVSLMTSVYTKAQLNEGFHLWSDYNTAESDYTPIYKTQSFPNADTKAKLWDYAKDFIKNNYYKASSSYSVKALDMHIIDSSQPRILVGDVVDITYPVYGASGQATEETRKLVCKSVQYDLINPENNSYTLGIPNEMLDHEYGEQKKKGKGDATATSVGGGGGPGDDDKDIAWTFDTIGRTIAEDSNLAFGGLEHYRYYRDTGEMSGTVWCYDPATAKMIGRFLDPSSAITTRVVGKISDTYGVGYSESYGIYAFVWGESTKINMTTQSVHAIAHYYIKGNPDKIPYGSPLEPATIIKQVKDKAEKVAGGLKVLIDGMFHFGKPEKPDDDKSEDIKVSINIPKTYTGKDGKQETKDGFIEVEDLATPKYPSVETKILTMDEITAARLNAVEAFVASLTTLTVRSVQLVVLSLNALTVSSNAYIYSGPGLTGSRLEDCFIDADVTTFAGQKMLVLKRVSNTNNKMINISDS